MDDIEIVERLSDLGFIIKRRLKFGKNRVATEHKPDKRNGCIYLNEDSVVYMSFDESIEQGHFWIKEDKYKQLTYEERSLLIRQKKAEADAMFAIERQKQQIEIQLSFSKMYRLSYLHPYLVNKKAHRDRKLRIDWYKNLVIPMYNIDRTVRGYQMIKPDGEKRYKTGSQLFESFFPIVPWYGLLKDQKIILLAEGYATASSIYQATNLCTVVCFSCINMRNIRRIMEENYPNVRVVSVRDNDSAGINSDDGFGFTVGEEGDDANDYANKFGLNSLREKILQKLGESE